MIWMLAANAAALLGARALLRRVASPDPAFNWVAGILIHLVLITAATLAAGLAGALKPWVLGAAGLAALAGLLLAKELGAPSPPLRIPLGRIPAVLLVGIGAGLAVQVWTISPWTIDPTSYHLPKVAEWVRSGSVLALSGADPRETFPAGFELVETWWVLFLRHDVLIELAGVEFLALGAAATLLLASRLGLPESSRPWCAVLYLLTPALYFQSTSAMNDGAVAALGVAAAALVASRASLWLLATLVLLGAGIKPTFLVLLPGFALLAWTLRSEPWATPLRSRTGWAVAVASLLPGSVWYLRNLAVYGNPLFPAGDARHWGVPTTSDVVLEAGNRIDALIGPAPADALAPVGELLVHGAGWGLVAFAVGLPALMAAVREERSWRRMSLAFVAGLVAMAFAVHPQFHFLRFVLFFPALLSVAAVRWAHRHPRFRPVLAVAGVILFVQAQAVVDLKPESSLGWKERGRDVRLPPDAEVAAIPGLNGMSYSLWAPDFRRRVYYLGELKDVAALKAELDRLGVDYLDTRGERGTEPTREAARRLALEGSWRERTSGLLERVKR